MNIINNFKNQLKETYAHIDQLRENQENVQQNRQEQQKIEEIPFEDKQKDQFQYFASLNTKPKIQNRKCIVCSKLNAKYVCPSCKVPYCSIAHFKSHNLFCSQRFYRNQVENQLKSTKATKQSKLKTIEMLKQNNQEMGKDDDELMTEISISQISQGRLLDLLEQIENGNEVKLEEKEQILFQSYIKSIQNRSSEEDQQNSPFLFNLPFWEIEEGLSYYFLQSEPQVQEYLESKNQTVIQYRSIAAKKMKEKIQSLSQLKKILPKLSKYVNFQLLQIGFLGALMFRATNGGQNHQYFIQTFQKLYNDDFGRTIQQMGSQNRIQIDSLSLIQSKINYDQWLMPWIIIVIQDSERIFKNKYLILELLYRMIEIFSEGNSNKFIKKLQLLLFYVNDASFNSSKENTLMILSQLEHHKLKLLQAEKDKDNIKNQIENQKQLRLNGILLPK